MWEKSANRVIPAASNNSTLNATWIHARDGTTVISSDPWLETHREHLKHRYSRFQDAVLNIDSLGGLDVFSRGYEVYGFTREIVNGRIGIRYREWAPGARDLSLIGDFNSWDPAATSLTRDTFGVWTAFLPDPSPDCEAIPHNSFVRLSVVIADGSRVNRLPAYIRYAVYDEKLNEYVGKYWHPPPSDRHAWRHERISSHVAANYVGVLGCARIPSRSAWLGTVGPTEAEIYGLSSSSGDNNNSSSKQSPGEEQVLAVAYSKALTRNSTIVADVERALASAAVIPERTSSGSGSADPAAAGIRIYESHIGMAGEEGKVSSYREFATNVLPRIKKLGYNCGTFFTVYNVPSAPCTHTRDSP